MQLFMPRRSLVRDLGRGRCVLLPSDPGQERMLEFMRLFNPAARPASAGRISADGRHISLTRPQRIDAETASRAQTPPGLSTVYFVQITVASPRLTPSAVAQGLKELKQTATLLIGGLAGCAAATRTRSPRISSRARPGTSLSTSASASSPPAALNCPQVRPSSPLCGGPHNRPPRLAGRPRRATRGGQAGRGERGLDQRIGQGGAPQAPVSRRQPGGPRRCGS